MEMATEPTDESQTPPRSKPEEGGSRPGLGGRPAAEQATGSCPEPPPKPRLNHQVEPGFSLILSPACARRRPCPTPSPPPSGRVVRMKMSTAGGSIGRGGGADPPGDRLQTCFKAGLNFMATGMGGISRSRLNPSGRAEPQGPLGSPSRVAISLLGQWGGREKTGDTEGAKAAPCAAAGWQNRLPLGEAKGPAVESGCVRSPRGGTQGAVTC